MIVYRPLKAIRLKCLDCSESRKDVTGCPCNGVKSPLCNLHPYRFGKRPRSRFHLAVLACPTISETRTVSAVQTDPSPKSIKNTTPRRAIREHCLDCARGNAKYILWCPCDGLHSSPCPLWPHRLGARRATALARYPGLVTPEAMPPAAACLDDLPNSLPDAVAYLIEHGHPAAPLRQRRVATARQLRNLERARAAQRALQQVL
jgi:hypothetical protein